MKKQQPLPKTMQKFLADFHKRFDAEKTTHCDYEKCKTRLLANQIQVFTMPNLEVKIFCFEHMIATLFRFDKKQFEKIIDDNYQPTERESIKNYFQDKYTNQN